MRRWILVVIGVLVALPVLVVGAGLAWVQTASGQRQLAGLIERLTSGSSTRIALDGISGSVPFDMTVTGLSVADAQGVWLTVDRATLSWSPLALLEGELRIDALTFGTVTVTRTPEGGGGGGGSTGLPRLPVAVRLERFAVDTLALGEPVLGAPAQLTAEGSARLGDLASGLQAHLAARRTDAVPGTLALDLAYVPAEQDRLSVTLALDEPEGGMVARALALPGLPPVAVHLDGSGPLDDWQARLTGRAGDVAGIDGTARVQAAGSGRAVTLDGSARVAGLLGPELVPLVQDGVTLSGAATLLPGGVIAVDQVRLAAAAGTVTLSGRIDRTADTLGLSYRVQAGDPAMLAGLTGGLGWDALTLEGRIGGTLAAPAPTATLTAEALRRDALRADRVTLTLEATPSAALSDPATVVALRGSGAVRGLDLGSPKLEPLVTPEIGLDLAGSVTPASGAAALDRLALTLPPGTLTATGTAAAWGAQVAGQAELSVPDLAALAPVTGRPLGGAATVTVEGRRAGADLAATLSGTLTDLATGSPQAERLLGQRVTLDGRVASAPTGDGYEISGLAVRGAQIALTADGKITGANTLAADWRLALTDLSVLDPALAGTVQAGGKLSGPVASPTLAGTVELRDAVLAGQPVPQATLETTIADLAASPSGQLRLTATARDLPVEASTRFALAPQGGVRLDDLSLTAASLRLAGAVTVGGGGLAEGTLSGGIGRLADFSALAGQPLAGSADLRATLAAPQGRQNLSARLQGSNLAFGQTAQAGTLTLTADLTDLLGTPALSARLAATPLQLGGQSLDRVEATAEGGMERLGVTLAAMQAQQTALQARATIARQPELIRIDLTALEARYQDQRISLVQPATVQVQQTGGITIQRLVLAGNQGRISLEGSAGERFDLALDITDLPLALARLVDPALVLEGRLDGQARLTGTRAAPDARLTLRAGNVQVRSTAAAGLPAFNATADARWQNGQLTAQAAVTPATGGRLAVTARAPLPPDPATGLPAVGPDVPVQATATGNFDLASLNPLLAAGGSRVGGRIDIDLRVAGTIGAPQGQGTIRLGNGSYEDVLLGVRLDSIDAVLTGSGESLTLTQLNARTPNGGQITGSGTVSLNPEAGLPASLRLGLRNALLVTRDEATATADGDLTLTGPLLEQPLLAGTITILRAEIRIPEQLPPSVRTIDVVEVNTPPDLAAEERELGIKEEPGSSKPALAAGLDLTVAAPQAVFIRGRGADIELTGRLQITGTTADPIIVGQLRTRRGTLDLLGQRLTFQRGVIAFTGKGGTPDPSLDFLASTKTGDVTAQVAVTGTASAPQLTLQSDPPLPQDEILARLLFGKATSQLTATQALQLAQSAATLAGLGGGTGLVDRVRQTLGLDRLDIETGAQGGSSVSAGKYVSEGVYVGVQQGLNANSSRVTVQIEVTPNVNVETDVGLDSSNRFGVNMQWEY